MIVTIIITMYMPIHVCPLAHPRFGPFPFYQNAFFFLIPIPYTIHARIKPLASSVIL